MLVNLINRHRGEKMNEKLRTAFDAEFAAGRDLFSNALFEEAFHHFERAHVLGQFYVVPHVKTHIWMFFIGLRTGNFKEVLGQTLRIPLAMIGSALGKVPLGNTGGTNVKLTTTMPIPDDLKQYLEPDTPE